MVVTETRDGHAILSVANDGPTVPAAEIERLFQPFQRLGSERTGPREGVGLGLSIVEGIATAHDASCTARPRPHGGLDVEVCFPTSSTRGLPATPAPATGSPRITAAWVTEPVSAGGSGQRRPLTRPAAVADAASGGG